MTITRRSAKHTPLDEAQVANATVGDRCVCEVCKTRRFEREPLGPAVIHQYSYKPTRWDLKKTIDDPDIFYMGVELETDNYSDEGPRAGSNWQRRMRAARITNEEAAGLREPKTFWIPKYDGSITGPEFVSMPATLAWWQQHEEIIARMLKALLHGGFRSHDNDKCGFHVNISKTAFADSGHLYRFLCLIHDRPKWTVKMSQRTEESARKWARLELKRASQRRRMAEQATDPIQGSGYYTDHSVALGVPYGEARFEFRLPRGTLRIDRFMKNLEWTHAMIEYTREESRPSLLAPGEIRKTSGWPVEFMKWATKDGRYPHLAAFIAEKFGSTVVSPEEAVAWHKANGENVRETALHFGLYPSTIYHWLNGDPRPRKHTHEVPIETPIPVAADLPIEFTDQLPF